MASPLPRTTTKDDAISPQPEGTAPVAAIPGSVGRPCCVIHATRASAPDALPWQPGFPRRSDGSPRKKVVCGTASSSTRCAAAPSASGMCFSVPSCVGRWVGFNVDFAGNALCRMSRGNRACTSAADAGLFTAGAVVCRAGRPRCAETSPRDHGCYAGLRGREFDFFEPAGSSLPAAPKENT